MTDNQPQGAIPEEVRDRIRKAATDEADGIFDGENQNWEDFVSGYETGATAEYLRQSQQQVPRLDKILFDIKYLQNEGWRPGEEDGKYCDAKTISEATANWQKLEADVLFENTIVHWDSCDCSEYGCSHGRWPYEITFSDQEKANIQFEDDGLFFEGTKCHVSVGKQDEFTMADFVRFCSLAGIELKFKKPHPSPSPVTSTQEEKESDEDKYETLRQDGMAYLVDPELRPAPKVDREKERATTPEEIKIWISDMADKLKTKFMTRIGADDISGYAYLYGLKDGANEMYDLIGSAAARSVGQPPEWVVKFLDNHAAKERSEKDLHYGGYVGAAYALYHKMWDLCCAQTRSKYLSIEAQAELETQIEDVLDQKLELSQRILNVIAEKEALQAQLSEAQRNLTSLISEALEKSKQLDEACRERDDYRGALIKIKVHGSGIKDHARIYGVQAQTAKDVLDKYQPSKPTQ